MSLRNTEESYGKLTVIIHWVMAVLIIGLVVAGYMLDFMPKGDAKMMVVTIHKATGFLLLFVGLFRWYWMLSSQTPNRLPNITKAETGVAHATKWLLMLLLVVMPFSGLMMSMYHGYGVNFFWLFDVAPWVEKNKETGKLFGAIHHYAGYLLSAVILLHLFAAIKHHFVNKDDTLNRMLGRK